MLCNMRWIVQEVNPTENWLMLFQILLTCSPLLTKVFFRHLRYQFYIIFYIKFLSQIGFDIITCASTIPEFFEIYPIFSSREFQNLNEKITLGKLITRIACPIFILDKLRETPWKSRNSRSIYHNLIVFYYFQISPKANFVLQEYLWKIMTAKVNYSYYALFFLEKSGKPGMICE